jgi:succinoglycan biosynthesis protein ExoA
VNIAVHTYGADAQFLIRIDAHADYPDNYCKILIDEVQKTNAASVVVAMKTEGRQGFQKAVAAAQNSKLGNGGSAHRVADGGGMWTDHGHHALMRTDAFRKVGGYDESFTHNEDAELDMRLAQAGFKIWLTDRTSLVYYPRSSPMALLRQYIKYGEGRARTILKHRALPKLRQLAPAAVLPALLLGFLSPLLPIAALPLALWMLICIAYGVMLGVRTGNLSLLAAGPAFMIMHLGWSLGFWSSMLNRQRSVS